jgi:hypothetical protein
VAAVALLLALVGRLVFQLWEPPFAGALEYDTYAPLGDAWWVMNLYLGGPSFALSFVAVAVCIVSLCRTRGLALAVGAATGLVVGGILFALAIVAEVQPFAWATDPDAFPVADGRDLFTTFGEQVDRLVPAIVGSQIAIALSFAVGLVAILLARSTPAWLPVVGLVLVAGFFALPGTGASGVVQSLLQLVLTGAIGVAAVVDVRRTA